jgi:hypothetical protein
MLELRGGIDVKKELVGVAIRVLLNGAASRRRREESFEMVAGSFIP